MHTWNAALSRDWLAVVGFFCVVSIGAELMLRRRLTWNHLWLPMDAGNSRNQVYVFVYLDKQWGGSGSVWVGGQITRKP